MKRQDLLELLLRIHGGRELLVPQIEECMKDLPDEIEKPAFYLNMFRNMNDGFKMPADKMGQLIGVPYPPNHKAV